MMINLIKHGYFVNKERRVVLSHAKQDLTFKVIGEQLKPLNQSVSYL